MTVSSIGQKVDTLFLNEDKNYPIIPAMTDKGLL